MAERKETRRQLLEKKRSSPRSKQLSATRRRRRAQSVRELKESARRGEAGLDLPPFVNPAELHKKPEPCGRYPEENRIPKTGGITRKRGRTR